ncbi:DUF72 domain-containing protein [Pedobacter namyangjuensis]|uniref:DUF72 domain-containing protein n=1 Tax=Pedobacter namyangjuensis TaxID=600626 RepID=UPI000DE1BD0F|nr:DUF72 domain-containing protein [Pedobacter namyangjuensis]
MEKKFYAGTSGLILPVPNKLYYPKAFKEKSRLSYYASLQNSIEINSSFYKLPQAKTVLKWANEVPDDFRFTFKVFKEITHLKQLAYSIDTVNRFMDVVANVGDKTGSLLIQFPPSVTVKYLGQIDQLLAQFKRVDQENLWDFSVEFRHKSLYMTESYEVLKQHGMAMVIQDKAKVASPMITLGDEFVYVRFHGPQGDYKGTYTYDTLSEYAVLISEWLQMEKRVYVYFNNTMGNVYENLQSLKKMLG